QVIGYASYGPWRPFHGFRETVEHSVYVRDGQRGKGLGRQLMQALIDQARADGLHMMVAAVTAGNDASIRLHEALGFEVTARMPQVGQKFGEWLELIFLQLRLDDRPSP
ncbi:MAG: GNAT family N-acetyltransferase, partial [Pseudomonadota bacterium]|nr:GNAT family N-acetyltransferase [Pseudomonadota bacterium]